MRHIIRILLLQLIVAISLFSGDLTITYKVKVSSMMGIASQTDTIVEYHSSHHKRVSYKEGQTDTIYDYNNFIKYEINHKKKLFVDLRWMM